MSFTAYAAILILTVDAAQSQSDISVSRHNVMFTKLICIVLVKYEDVPQFELIGMSDNENYRLRYVFST